MSQLLGTFAFIFCLLLAAILVDRLYARFRRRHPELGPFRNPEGGCGCCAARGHCETGSRCDEESALGSKPGAG